MLLIHRPRQHHNLACAARGECKSPAGCGDGGQRLKQPAQTSDLDTQPRAMRFVRKPRSKCPGEEQVSWHIARPCFSQCACEREQYRTSGDRNDRACATYDMTAGVHDERF